MLSTPSNILASLLAKRAAQENMPMLPPEAQHEAGETPEQEAIEHLPGQYEESEVEPDEIADSEVEQMLSQLSPEQLEELTSLLAEDMHEGDEADEAAEPGGETADLGDDVDPAELAQAIEEHLANNPEANPSGIPPEKMAALNFVKSASYIEGFIEQALERGSSIKEAVDIYDSALSKSIAQFSNHKSAASSSRSEEDLTEKQAAYYEGVLERARECGFSDAEALSIVKAAMMNNPAAGVAIAAQKAEQAAKAKAKAKANAKAVRKAAKKRHATRNPGMDTLYRLNKLNLYKNRGTAMGLGGLAAGLAGGAMLSQD